MFVESAFITGFDVSHRGQCAIGQIRQKLVNSHNVVGVLARRREEVQSAVLCRRIGMRQVRDVHLPADPVRLKKIENGLHIQRRATQTSDPMWRSY